MDSTVEILLQAGMNESGHGEIVVNHKLYYSSGTKQKNRTEL